MAKGGQRALRLCAVNGVVIPGSVQPRSAVNLLQLLSEQFFGRHLPFGSTMNKREVLDVDRLTVYPLGDTPLGDANGSGQLLLRPSKIDSLLNCAHDPKISGAYSDSQQRRLWNGSSGSISVANMTADPKKKAKMTAADKAAHKRLRAIWDKIPKNQRPKQEQLGLGSQSNVSQYLTGRIPLNYYAVTVFATKLGCNPTDIRDDLPEQQLLLSAAQKSPTESAAEVDRIWSRLSPQEKMLAIGLHQAFLQQINPPQQEEKNAPIHRSSSSGGNS